MNNFEIRVFITGDYQVGKSSIVQRFKKLNSTQTENDDYFFPEDPKDEYGLGKIKTKETSEKLAKYQQLDDVEKILVRKQIERKSLMKFKKIFIVGHTRLEFNFFPIKSADEKTVTGITENKEDDEEIKFGNKLINFKNVINEIRKIYVKDLKDSNANLATLFLFVYDLKDFSTFKKMEIYFNKLGNYFQADSNYLKAIIGNKADLRVRLQKRDKEYFEKFMKNNSDTKHYEISTYNYFNFEKFFEQLFIDIISPLYEELHKQTFLNRFHLVLHKRANLSKAERKIHDINDVPFLGENDNPDVYAYPEDKAEFRRTFSNMKRGRYGFKIFINKQGPIFPVIDKQGQEKNKQGGLLSKPGTALGRDKKSKTAIGFGNWEISNKNKEIREALMTNIPGYSLGIRGGRYGFKKERKKKFKEREEELKSAFQQHYNGLHERKELDTNKKNIDYIENKKEIMKEIVDKIQENENKHLKDREKNKKIQDDKLKEKIEKIKTKQDKYQQIYEKNQKEMRKKKAELSHPKTATIRKGKTPFRKMKDIPAYTLYDVTTKYDPNKGWTMGMKYNYNPNKNKDDPGFPTLKSDFDRIVNSPKYAEIKYTAPRFKEEKIVQPSEDLKLYDDTAYKEKIANIKEKGERSTNLKTFLEERKYKKEKVMENKQRIEEARKEELEDLKARIPKTGTNANEYGYNSDLVDINYNLVEDSSPNYTMKGRYNHGSIFDMPDNYSVVNNDDEDEENKIGSNGKPIQDEEYKKSLPVPQYDVVKPSLPTYSFNKAKRFYDKPLYQPSPNAIPVMPFENGIFKPPDHESKSIGQGFMGKAKKDNVLKGNGIPGPGQYRIKGFAEIIAEKGRKISKDREKNRRKRELKELEMKKENQKKDENDGKMILKISDTDNEDDDNGKE
jgi:hypothetical protein